MCCLLMGVVLLCQLKSAPAAGVVSIVGGFLLHLSFGTVRYFGNLMPYMVSYLRNRVPSQVGV